ncbi:hypothetical protein [Pseudobutyrivibrio ruminis]|uniref:Uncharacterized protein n=1 Tax=Pseudobutyrivibrio ruminis DSM 9787 TaxID=1123011 RepID=A0A285RF72_9FIRM|nr:hypothetical protein [Pseudobutyrivibrio ruminis]SOB91037.1 hypothetical protein SAMN02910411_0685 [Pseudobutyrivibrio ruminis DSM 9787]
MTDVFTDIIIRIEGWGYVLIPAFCIIMMVLLRKRWIYSLCTVAVTVFYAWVELKFINYRAQFSTDVGGIALAQLIFPGLYIILGLVFFTYRSHCLDEKENLTIVQQGEKSVNSRIKSSRQNNLNG